MNADNFMYTLVAGYQVQKPDEEVLETHYYPVVLARG